MDTLSPGRLAQIACLLEVTARKPGNVHRYRDFEDLNYLDFVLSAGAIVEPLDRARETGVGVAARRAVEATRTIVNTNTNLGMILLLAPLAAIEPGEPWREGVEKVLAGLTVADAREVYAAIRMAQPGGLGEAPEQDVTSEPTVNLREAMRLAADRDQVARQYALGYPEVFAASTILRAEVEGGTALEEAILIAFVALLVSHPDSLIARKRGMAEAREASARARSLLQGAQEKPFHEILEPLDAWCRAEGNGRNPGATADLITGAIYVALRERWIPLPLPRWNKIMTQSFDQGASE